MVSGPFLESTLCTFIGAAEEQPALRLAECFSGFPRKNFTRSCTRAIILFSAEMYRSESRAQPPRALQHCLPHLAHGNLWGLRAAGFTKRRFDDVFGFFESFADALYILDSYNARRVCAVIKIECTVCAYSVIRNEIYRVRLLIRAS